MESSIYYKKSQATVWQTTFWVTGAWTCLVHDAFIQLSLGLPISFQMIPRLYMPKLSSNSKIKIRVFLSLLTPVSRNGHVVLQITVLRGFKGVLGDQAGSNAQNMVALNSPNDKLSNDTPHDYGTLKYKIAVLRGFKGVLGWPGGLKCPKYGCIELS